MAQLPDAEALARMVTRNSTTGVRQYLERTGYTDRSQRADMVQGMAPYMAAGTSPFQGLPVSAQSGEFHDAGEMYDAISIFDDESDDYLDYSESGYNYNNLADQPMKPKAPAPLSVVPTSTINPERPRTVAAGYDPRRAVLTVVFRDGTYYNYYEVMPSTWRRFKMVRSKGRFILSELDAHPRGAADVSSLPGYARDSLYRVIRTGQIFQQGYQHDDLRRRHGKWLKSQGYGAATPTTKSTPTGKRTRSA